MSYRSHCISNYRKELDEANVQLEDQTSITNSLMSSRDDVIRRFETRNREHQSLMNERLVTVNSHAVSNSKVIS